MLVGYGVCSVPVFHLTSSVKAATWHGHSCRRRGQCTASANGLRSGDLNISEVIFKSEWQFSYLFTWKNAHLSSISYNFGTQANIAMKFAEYVV